MTLFLDSDATIEDARTLSRLKNISWPNLQISRMDIIMREELLHIGWAFLRFLNAFS